MSQWIMNDDQEAAYHEDGYLLVPGLFNDQEMGLLLEIAKSDKQLMDDADDRLDASGATSRLTVRHRIGDDVYGAVARSRRLVEGAQKLLGQEPRHFHHKMMLKEPHVGGAWEWHQDYGYWYRNERFLFPNMISVLLAVDRANKANGCLEVLRGSHKAGRIEHGATGGQVGANLEQVGRLEQRLQRVPCELEPGDVLFFHCNLLHCSAANLSEHSRWSLISCYTAVDNMPEHRAPSLTYDLDRPIDWLEDEAFFPLAAAERDHMRQAMSAG